MNNKKSKKDIVFENYIEWYIVLIHFGGSGNEILLTKQLNRHYISAEIDKIYYDMILERIKNNGYIPQEYRLKYKKEKINKNCSDNVSSKYYDDIFNINLS
jgi:DNA modification methylase